MLVMQQTGNRTVNNFDRRAPQESEREGQGAVGNVELCNAIKIKVQLQLLTMGREPCWKKTKIDLCLYRDHLDYRTTK